jgi:hypothetical protein
MPKDAVYFAPTSKVAPRETRHITSIIIGRPIKIKSEKRAERFAAFFAAQMRDREPLKRITRNYRPGIVLCGAKIEGRRGMRLRGAAGVVPGAAGSRGRGISGARSISGDDRGRPGSLASVDGDSGS